MYFCFTFLMNTWSFESRETPGKTSSAAWTELWRHHYVKHSQRTLSKFSTVSHWDIRQCFHLVTPLYIIILTLYRYHCNWKLQLKTCWWHHCSIGVCLVRLLWSLIQSVRVQLQIWVRTTSKTLELRVRMWRSLSWTWRTTWRESASRTMTTACRRPRWPALRYSRRSCSLKFNSFWLEYYQQNLIK